MNIKKLAVVILIWISANSQAHNLPDERIKFDSALRMFAISQSYIDGWNKDLLIISSYVFRLISNHPNVFKIELLAQTFNGGPASHAVLKLMQGKSANIIVGILVSCIDELSKELAGTAIYLIDTQYIAEKILNYR